MPSSLCLVCFPHMPADADILEPDVTARAGFNLEVQRWCVGLIVVVVGMFRWVLPS
ncbi:MAG: hypothetical protein LBJ43_01950 [Propionibacteriaceae bacterium]|nr:hypothetical protein [Propionibacteriaceae bacterium]